MWNNQVSFIQTHKSVEYENDSKVAKPYFVEPVFFQIHVCMGYCNSPKYKKSRDYVLFTLGCFALNQPYYHNHDNEDSGNFSSFYSEWVGRVNSTSHDNIRDEEKYSVN